MKKDYIKKNSGFTLIEVILSIAIIGIIAVAFIPVFTGGFKSIVYAGKVKTKMFNSQKVIEQEIAIESKTGTSTTVDVTFPPVSGKPQYDISRSALKLSDGTYVYFSTELN